MADRYILTTVLAALLLVACSGTDESLRDNGKVNDPTDLINYTVAASQTRSTVIRGTEFPVDQKFRVWAYEEDGGLLIDGDIVSCTSGSVWSTQEKYYWPNGSAKVSFYALYPTTLNLDKTIRSFTYTVPGDVGKQCDLLFGFVKASKSDDNVSYNPVKRFAVPMTFHHALTQIAFKGRVSADNKDLTVSVKGIKVCNVLGEGSFDLNTMKWRDLSALHDYSVGISSDANSFSYSTPVVATDLTDTDGVLLLIPQSLSAWDRKNNVSETSDSYLAIECHIRQGSTDVIGTADKPATVYVPFDSGSSSWERGRRYIYTLEFGTGYNANGQPQLHVLVVGSEITDWVEGDGGSIGAKMTRKE